MNLNIEKWKEFKVGRLFELVPTKGKDSTDLIEGNEIAYIAAKKDDNGLMLMCQRDGFENWISKGNCIVFICLGAGSAGYTTYQKDDFIAMNGKTICGYNKNLNFEIGSFIVSVLDCERPKYSFGRSWTGDRLKNTLIKLPIKFIDEDIPLIDNEKTYSDEGFVPDWKFMEDYIKSLRYKPITTLNKQKEFPINTDKWIEFRIGDIFSETEVKHYSKIPEDEGKIPFISSTSINNGVAKKVSNVETQKGNCITVSTNGACLDCFYQPEEFAISSDVEALYNDNLNKYNALFICSVIEKNKYKYNYGIKPKNGKLYDLKIVLPSKENQPDWDFMTNYIKELPYGDKI